MKNYILLALLFLIGTSAFAQNIPTPEFTGRPYALENGKLAELERVDAQMDQKLKGMGYGGVEIYYTAFTEKSSIRFSKDQLPKLIISVEKGVDPADGFTIIKGTVKKGKKGKEGKRNFRVGNYGMGGSAQSNSDAQILATYKKVKDGVYEIVLPDETEAGEYAFVPNGIDAMSAGNKMKITCFGID